MRTVRSGAAAATKIRNRTRSRPKPARQQPRVETKKLANLLLRVRKHRDGRKTPKRASECSSWRPQLRTGSST